MKISVVNKSKYLLPSYPGEILAGIDVWADIEEDIILKPLEKTTIKTRLFLDIPVGYKAQIKPGRGLAIIKGVTLHDTSGKVDADYREEVSKVLINLSGKNFVIKDDERMSQRVVAKHEKTEKISVEALAGSDSGAGGFGHTGKKQG